MRNRDAKIAERKPFKGSNMYGGWDERKLVYVVYSYGPHWPLAVWTGQDGWVRNASRYGQPTTRRHQSIVDAAVPGTPAIWINALRELIASYRDAIPVAPTQPTLTSKQVELFDVSM